MKTKNNLIGFVFDGKEDYNLVIFNPDNKVSDLFIETQQLWLLFQDRLNLLFSRMSKSLKVKNSNEFKEWVLQYLQGHLEFSDFERIIKELKE